MGIIGRCGFAIIEFIRTYRNLKCRQKFFGKYFQMVGPIIITFCSKSWVLLAMPMHCQNIVLVYYIKDD